MRRENGTAKKPLRFFCVLKAFFSFNATRYAANCVFYAVFLYEKLRSFVKIFKNMQKLVDKSTVT